MSPAPRRSHELPRHLRLPDLVLAQVLVVVGTSWFGAAAKLGGAGMVMWLLAIALFHLPLAVVVMALTRVCPLEGGPYEWAQRAYGPVFGFLIAWTVWIFVLVMLSSSAIQLVTGAGYVAGAVGVLEGGTAQMLGVLAVIGLLVLVGFSGFRTARWLQDLAALGLLAVVALLGSRLVAALIEGRTAALALAWPAPTLANVVLLIKVSVYGLAGLEFLSIVAGETRDPSRALPRSVAIAAPTIGSVYVLGTAAMLVSVGSDAIDLVNPVAQALARFGGGVAVLVLCVLLLRDLGQMILMFGANTRLPMTAGWHGAVPAVLGATDARGVPRRAIALSAVVVLALAAFAIGSGGRQEAYQLLLSAAGILFGATYVVMFSLPLFGARALGLPRGWLLRICALLGFGISIAFTSISIFPIGDVPSPFAFAGRVLAIVTALVFPGLILATRVKRRGRVRAPEPDR